MQGMRHVLVHDYANIVSETLYDTAVNSIPELQRQVERYLVETDWDAWANADDPANSSSQTDNDDIVRMAKRMKDRNYSSEDIADITGLPLEFIESL